MHEAGLTQEVIDIVCEKAAGRRVRRVVLEVGEASCILPDAIRFCFDLCAEGTAAEGASLEIRRPAGEDFKLLQMELV